MSGIFGVRRMDGGPVDPGSLKAMGRRLAHRGFEPPRRWHEGALGLGHVSLPVAPAEAEEVQPLAFAGGACRLVADARIDNRADLASLLDLEEDAPDARFIARAYLRWGPACPEHLVGDFAFAVWDGREERLFLARDPMGVRPFYLHHVPGRRLVFASEIKGLLAAGGVPDEPSERAIAAYLDRAVPGQRLTFYRGIERLPAAHRMLLDASGLRTERYWEPDPERELGLSRPEEYAEAFRELFDEAVRCRLRSRYRTGVALSGGLDSSSIACTARELLRERPGAMLHGFSAVFPGLSAEDRALADESAWIERVVADGGVASHRVAADRSGPLVDPEAMIEEQDEPPLAVNLYLHQALCDLAARRWTRVLLDGLGGENTVSFGYERLDESARRGRWSDLGREARALAGRSGGDPGRILRTTAYPELAHLVRRGRLGAWTRAVRALQSEAGVPGSRLAWQFGVRPLVPEAVHRMRRQRSQARRRRWLTPEVAATLEPESEPTETSRAPRDGRRLHAEVIRAPLYPYALGLADRAAVRRGVRMRYPFLDRRLIEFCLAVPSREKLRDGWTRSLLRRGMGGRLPDEIRRRATKQDLTPGYVEGIRALGPRRLRSLTSDVPEVFRYVDRGEIGATRERFFSERAASDPEDAYALFLAASLATWLGSRRAAPARQKSA